METKTSFQDYEDCLSKTADGIGFELSPETIELGYEGMKHFHISVIQKACWWYIWHKPDKFKSNFLMDIRKRCTECNEFPSSYKQGGIEYGLVNVIGGKPNYKPAIELAKRNFEKEKQKKISHKKPAEPVKRISWGQVRNKIASLVKGTEPPASQKTNAADQVAKLKGMQK